MEKEKFASKIMSVIAVLVGIFVLTGCTKKVELNNYITISVNGYNSLGRVEVEFDKDAFREDYKGKISVNKDSISGEDKLIMNLDSLDKDDEDVAIDLLCETFSWKLDKTDHLSNGDTVTLEWKCKDSKAEKTYGAELVYSDIQYDVSGLDEVPKFNPFEGLNLTYSGMAPNGVAEIAGGSSKYSYDLSFSVSPQEGLSNGDTVIVRADIYDDEESFVRKYNALPEVFEKEYNVSGLMSSVTELAQITPEMMTQMKSQADDILDAFAASWDEEVKMSARKCVGGYFLTNKGNASDYNRCYLVYKIRADVHVPGTRPSIFSDYENPVDLNTDYYYYVMFRNLKIDEDGNGIIDISDYATAVDRFRYAPGIERVKGYKNDVWTYEFNGYESENLVKNEIVTKNAVDYRSEFFTPDSFVTEGQNEEINILEDFDEEDVRSESDELSDENEITDAEEEEKELTIMVKVNLSDVSAKDKLECEVGTLVEFNEEDMEGLKPGDTIKSLAGNTYTLIESPDGDDSELVFELDDMHMYAIRKDETGEKYIARSYESSIPLCENIHSEYLEFSDDAEVVLDKVAIKKSESVALTISGDEYKDLCKKYKEDGTYSFGKNIHIDLISPQWGYAEIEDEKIVKFIAEYMPA